MITISPETRISELIKANPDVIDAIASINPLFRKLKNPVLRKVLARRVTISEAVKIGKCSLSLFASKLRPLGFNLPYPSYDEETSITLPSGEIECAISYDEVLDVRQTINENKDPFQDIIKVLLNLREGGTLLLINSFVPFPLIKILERKGCDIVVKHPGVDVVYTYINKTTSDLTLIDKNLINEQLFEETRKRYDLNIIETDVRDMPMPLPMQHILGKLERLDEHKALLIYHKKIPMFLLPELRAMGYSYQFKLTTGALLMLIYKNINSDDAHK